MKRYILFLLTLSCIRAIGQEIPLNYYLERALDNNPALKENSNLKEIANLQEKISLAQENAFKIDITSELGVYPYISNNGRLVSISTNPSAGAFGYDVGITNGGLYSLQLNVTRNIFNQGILDNLRLKQKIERQSIALSSEEIKHNLIKNITDNYIVAYQYQLQIDLLKRLLADLDIRLKVVELLVKKGILSESDYMLLQLDINTRKLELSQVSTKYGDALAQLDNLAGIPLDSTQFQLRDPAIELSDTPQSYFYQRKFNNDSLMVVTDQLVYENKYKPRIETYANTGLNAVELPNIYHKIGIGAGIRLAIPVFDGKQREKTAMQSELLRKNLLYHRQAADVQKQNSLIAIQKQLSDLTKNIADLKMQLEEQQKIIVIYKSKLVQGQASIIDYLNVLQNYKMNEYALLQMKTNAQLLKNQFNYLNW